MDLATLRSIVSSLPDSADLRGVKICLDEGALDRALGRLLLAMTTTHAEDHAVLAPAVEALHAMVDAVELEMASLPPVTDEGQHLHSVLRSSDELWTHVERRGALRGVHVVGVELGAPLAGLDLSASTWLRCTLPTLFRCRLDGARMLHCRVGDLRGSSLVEAVLTNLDLRHANLTSTDFSKAREATIASVERAALGGANLDGIVLVGASLTGVSWTGVSLRGAQLDGVDLSHADLTGACLVDASFQGANLQHARLDDVDAAQVALPNVDLEHASLRGANLEGANLTNASLSGADLTAARLHEANLGSAQACRVILRDACLTRAQLQRADVSHASLAGADLSWADLSHARLASSKLVGAKLVGTNLHRTFDRDADFTGATLTRVRRTDPERARAEDFVP
jgi:uncharacterized protein YjbI with pentapeptide repeats